MQSVLRSWLALLLGFSGRSSRAQFWLVTLPMGAAFYALTKDVIPETLSGLFEFLLTLLPFISIIASSVKRLHDMNWRGWWIIVWYFAMYLALAEALDRKADTEGLIFNALLLMPGVLLGLVPGTHGVNRFGPEPIALRSN
jgi:uncharacterized membrane protein YhaH (DUF805 family)